MYTLAINAVVYAAEYTDFRRALASAKPPEVCPSCSVYRGTF